MKAIETLTLRVVLEGEPTIYREIEIEASKSLYKLAEAIVAALGFDFDHAFGFYSGLTPAKLMKTNPRYELFADMGDASPGVIGVKKTKISEAFYRIDHTMMFLFDYGDDWLFRVSLKAEGQKVARTRYPRIVATSGEAPPQYPAPEEIDDDRPRYGVNPLTGEKIFFKR